MNRLAVVALFFVVAAHSVAAAESVGWRTDGDGRYLDAAPPIHWSPDQNVAWKTAMPSWSNASLLFVCSEPDRVLAIDRNNGKIVWQQSVADVAQGDTVKTHDANGYTSTTPVTDGQRVFTLFGSGVVVAHTIKGQRLWARVVERPQHGWGHSASPALGGGRLIVHITDLIGLDPTTGAEVWRAPSAEKFGSPVVTKIGDTDIVITPSGDVFRAKDGKQLASEIGKLEYATPVVQDGVVYFIEKKATAVQLPKMLGEKFDSKTLWVGRAEGSRHYASSVIHDGLIYALSREEKFTILDAATGAVVHQQDLNLGERSGSNSAYASIALAGDKLFIGAENGTTVVLQPGRTYKEIARNKIEGFRSSPVFEGERMYLRAFDYLYCFEKK
jgi:outer membrane protein assembly factor BamB